MLKTQLDEYVKKYETPDFIDSDPVRFIHLFDRKRDIETAGFIASMFAYGKRELFIKKLSEIFDMMNMQPYEYVKSFDCKCHNLTNCDYRFSKTCDFVEIIRILNVLYNENETLESLFEYSYKQKNDVWGMFGVVTDYFYARAGKEATKGFYHLLPDPSKNSALKRMNMMMRWFVRKSCVDRGIWTFIKPSELMIPLDTHVAKIARELKLLTGKDNNRKSVIELTENLKKYDSSDPVKYDFALFGYGVNNKTL